MTEIYRHAYSVVVWLGVEEGDSAMEMSFLNEIGAFLVETKSAGDAGKKFRSWLRDTIWNNAYKVHWDGLRQIFQRSYWSRLWVIQELVVTPYPEGVKLLCGSSQARFIDLCMVVQQLTVLNNGIPHIINESTIGATITGLQKLGGRIRNVAVHAAGWEKTDRRERETGISRLLTSYSQPSLH
jgi:hypothetical protein